MNSFVKRSSFIAFCCSLALSGWSARTRQSTQTYSTQSSSSSSQDYFYIPSSHAPIQFVNEVSGSGSLLGVSGGGASGVLDVGSGGTLFYVSGSYFRALTSFIEVGGDASFAVVAGSSAFGLLVGPRFNFGHSMEDAIFATPEVGFTHAGGSTGFAFDISVGKRFRIFQNVSYAPQAGFYMIDEGGMKARFRIDAIRFTALFN